MIHPGKKALEDIIAGLDGVAKVAPGAWESDSEKMEDATPKHDEYFLMDGRGYRMIGTENCDYRFGEIHADGPDEDGFCTEWNEPSRLVIKHLERCQPDNMTAIAAYVAELEARTLSALEPSDVRALKTEDKL